MSLQHFPSPDSNIANPTSEPALTVELKKLLALPVTDTEVASLIQATSYGYFFFSFLKDSVASVWKSKKVLFVRD